METNTRKTNDINTVCLSDREEENMGRQNVIPINTCAQNYESFDQNTISKKHLNIVMHRIMRSLYIVTFGLKQFKKFFKND